MLVKLFIPTIQPDIMFIRSVVLVNSSNHKMLVNRLFPIMSVMSLTSIVLTNSSKHLMLLNLLGPVMQLILSFAIPLVSLFLILLVIFSQLNLLANLLMRPGNVLMNDLLMIRTVANKIFQNHLVP